MRRRRRSTFDPLFRPRLNLPLVFIFLFGGSLVILVWTLASNFVLHTAEVRILFLDVQNDTTREPAEGQWEVIGWTYVSRLEGSASAYAPPRFDPKEGFWVIAGPSPTNWVRLTGFQYWEPKRVLLGLRYYIHGSGTLEFRYEHVDTNLGDRALIVAYEGGNEAEHGFCNKIVAPNYGRLVDKIEVRGFVQDPESYIVVDEVLVTVGEIDSSRSLIYSMMPRDWCEGSGTQIRPQGNQE